jgi:hypothetical protein
MVLIDDDGKSVEYAIKGVAKAYIDKKTTPPSIRIEVTTSPVNPNGFPANIQNTQALNVSTQVDQLEKDILLAISGATNPKVLGSSGVTQSTPRK